uniref:Uncharacterized protein n=1 Tax=Glossina palpalis gambiensis TaxID=67801 RepID=A0A1B0AWS7_9MUSC
MYIYNEHIPSHADDKDLSTDLVKSQRLTFLFHPFGQINGIHYKATTFSSVIVMYIKFCGQDGRSSIDDDGGVMLMCLQQYSATTKLPALLDFVRPGWRILLMVF